MNGEPVTLHRVGASTTEDRWGNPLPGADNDVELSAAVWPVSAAELLAGQDVATTRLRVAYDGALDVAATDEMTARGRRYAIHGEPALFLSPFTGRSVTQLDLVAKV